MTNRTLSPQSVDEVLFAECQLCDATAPVDDVYGMVRWLSRHRHREHVFSR